MTLFALVLALGVSRADCVLERTGRLVNGVFTLEVDGRVGPGPVPCRELLVGFGNDVVPTSVRAEIRQWDDTRTVLGEERLYFADGAWRLSLPELQDEVRFSVRVDGERGPSWPAETETPLRVATRLDWLPHRKPTFGPDGNVLVKEERVYKVEGQGSVAHLWFPEGTTDHQCHGGTQVFKHERGCAFVREAETEGLVRISWLNTGFSSSMEWELGPEESLVLGGITVASAGIERASKSGPARFNGPGAVSIRVTALDGVAVPNTALQDVEYGARAQSMPEPSVGLTFKGVEVTIDDVDAVVQHVRSQVVSGSLPGSHPLKPRSLMAARSSGWATPFEAALILTRYLEQLGFTAKALPVRPKAKGAAVGGAPLGFVGAVVYAEKDGRSVWLDPSCRVCGVGEVSPALWGGQVFDEFIKALPEAPQFDHTQVLDGDGMLRVSLTGTAALRLRQTIMGMAMDAPREKLIAELFGGQGARLTSIDGLSDFGSPIHVVIAPQSLK